MRPDLNWQNQEWIKAINKYLFVRQYAHRQLIEQVNTRKEQ